MRSVIELTNTTTGTSNVAGITPEIWSATVEQQAQALRVARNFCRIDRSLVGRPGDVVHILKGAKLTTAADVETSHTEGNEATYYALDDYGTLDLTPAPFLSSVRITDDVIEEVQADVLADANYLIAEALAQYEDTLILSTVADTSSINEVWGGDATSEADLDTGDIMTTDLFANALRELRIDSYGMATSNLVCFIHPYMENAFLKDSQFVNAAEFGSDTVIQKGVIGKYLGVTIVSTPNVTANSPNSGSGYTCLMWEVGKGPVVAVKHDVRVETDRNVQYQCYDVVGRIKFAVGVLFVNAVCKLECTIS